MLENAVRPAMDSAHRPVGEPAGQHSTANQMSGLQATDRTSGATAIRTEIDTDRNPHCTPATKPPDFWYLVRDGFFSTDFFPLRGGTFLMVPAFNLIGSLNLIGDVYRLGLRYRMLVSKMI
jgi:hypothetical protein